MDDHRRYNDELYQTVGAFLLGRLTYEIFAAAWPTVTDEHDQIARALNTLPKYVASATMRPEQATWAGTTILNGDAATEVTRLKEEPGRPILVAGSARLVQDLQRHDLVDETGSGCTRSCSAAASGCSPTGPPRSPSGSSTA